MGIEGIVRMLNKKRFVAVIGGSEPSAQEAKLAEEVGRELVDRSRINISYITP